jgi:hypothetical protein
VIPSGLAHIRLGSCGASSINLTVYLLHMSSGAYLRRL